MDDLIVIIMTLLIVIVGAIGQIKKKQRNEIAEEEGEEKNTVNFWDEFLGENGNKILAEEKQQPGNFVNRENIVAEKKEPKPLFEEGVSIIERKPAFKDEIKKTEIGSEKAKNNILAGFSAKKAIIFSEIIQRKYF